jgi:hypothetical protein
MASSSLYGLRRHPPVVRLSVAHAAERRPPHGPEDGGENLLADPERCPPDARATKGLRLDERGRLPDGDRLIDGEPFLRWLETGEGDPWAASSG